jgi:regulator of sigma E protease
MIDMAQTIIVTLATFAIVVGIHEYGHFWMARRAGVKVLRFSIGFGRPLIRWQGADDTEYVLAAIPLGGYVRMADEHDAELDEADLSRAHSRQSVGSRMAIAAAGPLANFLLAIVVLWGLFLRGEMGIVPEIAEVLPASLAEQAGLQAGQEIREIDNRSTPTLAAVNFALLERLGDSGALRLAVSQPGSDVLLRSEVALDQWLKGAEQPNLLDALGITIRTPPVVPLVGGLVDEGRAAAAGFEVGDLILEADGEVIELWMDWVVFVRARPDQPIEVVVQRNGTRQPLSVTPAALVSEGERIGAVGMSVQLPEIPLSQQRFFERGPVDALVAAVTRTSDLVVFTFKSILRMLQGLISPSNLSGPITIAQVAASTAESGWVAWFGFLALLSVSLGALNLLPIPVLDGGAIVFCVFEAVLGKPLPERVQMVGYQVGVALVLSIMVFALYNDVAKL